MNLKIDFSYFLNIRSFCEPVSAKANRKLTTPSPAHPTPPLAMAPNVVMQAVMAIVGQLALLSEQDGATITLMAIPTIMLVMPNLDAEMLRQAGTGWRSQVLFWIGVALAYLDRKDVEKGPLEFNHVVHQNVIDQLASNPMFFGDSVVDLLGAGFSKCAAALEGNRFKACNLRAGMLVDHLNRAFAVTEYINKLTSAMIHDGISVSSLNPLTVAVAMVHSRMNDGVSQTVEDMIHTQRNFDARAKKPWVWNKHLNERATQVIARFHEAAQVAAAQAAADEIAAQAVVQAELDARAAVQAELDAWGACTPEQQAFAARLLAIDAKATAMDGMTPDQRLSAAGDAVQQAAVAQALERIYGPSVEADARWFVKEVDAIFNDDDDAEDAFLDEACPSDPGDFLPALWTIQEAGALAQKMVDDTIAFGDFGAEELNISGAMMATRLGLAAEDYAEFCAPLMA